MKQQLPDHLAYQAEQEKLGTLVMAGPMSDPSGELMEGVGMIIYRAESLDLSKLRARLLKTIRCTAPDLAPLAFVAG